MKAYLIVTGLLFVALALAHLLRVFMEQHLIRDPFFVTTTIIALVMAGWALRLFLKYLPSRHAHDR